MKLILVCWVTIVLIGCADTATLQQASMMEPVGFWYGLWHGAIFPFAWVISLFTDSVSIYAIYNNGGWYDFGFFLGVGGLSTGTANTK